ncbi:MAG TPA: DUF2934 domain-containing protein [Humisphaera sp.]
MASKKSTASKSSSKKPAAKATASTTVRHTPLPKMEAFDVPVAAAPAARPEVTSDMIAVRAYEIWSSGQGGSELENWTRAERELRAA